MPVTDDDIDQLVDSLDRGRDRWIHGDLDVGLPGVGVRQADDMTIFGPFGGESPKPGTMDPGTLIARQRAVAANFKGGTGRCELISAMIEGDLVVLVMVERNEVNFEGHDTPHPWVLRSTQVFRRQGQDWVRLHRHADPLIVRRDLNSTLALLQRA